MKRYREYMDSVRVSGELHRELLDLNAPEKRGAPWAKYGAWAAGLVLVCALGAWGLRAGLPGAGYGERLAEWTPEDAAADLPDIALLGPGESVEPAATRFAGDYEVTRDGVTAHYLLPYIEYTEAGNPNRYAVAADWDIPQGAVRSDLDRNHIARLLGGADVLSTHLDWDGYQLSGWAAWLEDGGFWGLYIDGCAGELDHFTFAVTAGQLPPTCVELPGLQEQNIHGLMVAANGYDSTASTRQVSFRKDGCGFRFDLTGTDADLAEERVSRLVRWVADDSGAWTPEALGITVAGNGTYTCEICGRDYPVGSAHGHPFMGGDTQDSYPAVSADPNDSPRDRGENWCGTQGADTETCPDCGATYPAGQAHDHSCEPDPVQVCDICGNAVHTGEHHGHGVCGYPLAPGTQICPNCGESYPEGVAHDCAMCDGYPVPRVCEVCGEAYPAGTAHTCRQQAHHQEQHHGGHH